MPEVPFKPQSLPSDVAPPPVPPPMPLVVPPSPPPPAVAPTPLPKNPHPHHYLVGIFVLVCALGVLGVLLLAFYPTLQRMIPQPAPQNVPTVLPPVTSTAVTPPDATTTAETSSTEPAYQEPATKIHALGETVRLFTADSAVFKNKSGTMFTVQVDQFTDSRCAKGNTCIWAGERGVILTVTDASTNQATKVSLGMVHERSGSKFGLTFMLKEVDDEKGGTYADITVK